MAKQAAKKPATKAKTENTTEQKVVIQEPIVETTIAEKKPKADVWEIKDRHYYLIDSQPLTYTIPSRHTAKRPLLWFDKTNNEQKEIRYATNQNSPLKEEQKGEVTLGHIMFKDGHLFVPKQYQSLQKLLSIYHPFLNKIYREHDANVEAEYQVDSIELELEALNLAVTMDIDMAEAIVRVESGSAVSNMSSKEIKRDLLLFAKRNPKLFLDLANDENVQLRNFAIKAKELGIIKLSQDQRIFSWASNEAKLMTVPFDENPYSAFAAYLQTNEGLEVYRSIDKKLS
jgi:hypothetical protein